MERDSDQKPRSIPVVEENLSFEKRKVTTGTKRVRKVVTEREETVDEPLQTTSYEVERVLFQTFVDEIEPTRREGNTTIIPVYEEVLITEKKLLLKEEIHITRRESFYSEPQRIALRKEEVHIEEVPEESSSPSEDSDGQSPTIEH